MSQAPHCSACKRDCELTNGAEIWPHRPDLIDVPSWICRGCKARVGCHPGTDKPLGTPADAETRRARRLLHDRLLDPLWKEPCAFDRKPARRRARVYRFLSEQLGITRDETHTGLFDLERCREAWRALRGVTYAQIHERREAQKRQRNDEGGRTSSSQEP